MSINLNDRASMMALDPHEMLRLTEEFPKQCREAMAIARAAVLQPLAEKPTLVVLTGMGGSASGGDFVRAIFEAEATMPFIVNRDYHLPNYVGADSLVFCASYSGDTEETLSAYADAKKAGAAIVVVTSGGQLRELAWADGFPVIQVPSGQPPRTALGYMMVPVLVACETLGLIPEQAFSKAFDLVQTTVNELSVGGSDSSAKELATKMDGGLSVIYGLGSWQGLMANRWRCQINENAKSLAFTNSFPELCHNEIMGWVKGEGKFTAIVLQDGTESAKMKTRHRVTQELIGEKASFVDVTAKGESLLEKMLSLATFGDFVSIYLARLNEVDPENIDWLNTLKFELGKIN